MRLFESPTPLLRKIAIHKEKGKKKTKEYPGKNLEFSKKVCITLYYFNPDHSLRSGKDKKILLGGQLYPVTN